MDQHLLQKINNHHTIDMTRLQEIQQYLQNNMYNMYKLSIQSMYDFAGIISLSNNISLASYSIKRIKLFLFWPREIFLSGILSM